MAWLDSPSNVEHCVTTTQWWSLSQLYMIIYLYIEFCTISHWWPLDCCLNSSIVARGNISNYIRSRLFDPVTKHPKSGPTTLSHIQPAPCTTDARKKSSRTRWLDNTCALLLRNFVTWYRHIEVDKRYDPMMWAVVKSFDTPKTLEMSWKEKGVSHLRQKKCDRLQLWLCDFEEIQTYPLVN